MSVIEILGTGDLILHRRERANKYFVVQLMSVAYAVELDYLHQK